MNNLYGQTQVLGKATVSNTKPIDNGLFNYVLPYNQNDFFAYSDISFSDISNCRYFNLEDNNIDQLCDEDPARKDLVLVIKNKKKEKKEIKLSSDYCYSRELCRNKSYADQILSIDNSHTAIDGQYLDAATRTNLEILNIANLSIGIIFMIGLAVSYS